MSRQHDRSRADAIPDPIVEEVRQARAKLWEKFGDDPERVFDHISAAEREHPERLIGPEEFLRRYGTADQRIPLPAPQPTDEDARRAS